MRTVRARLVALLAVVLIVLLGTSGRAQNPDSRFPFAAGGGYASQFPSPEVAGYVHFAFSAMYGPTGPPAAKGHGRFAFSNGDVDQGDVICFHSDLNNTARFTINVTKGQTNDKYLLVEVTDNGVAPDTVGYTRIPSGPGDFTAANCTVTPPVPMFPGPVFFGNVVVSDGSQ